MLRRVYPPLTDDTGTGNGTEERGVTGGETALAEASTRATLAETPCDDPESVVLDLVQPAVTGMRPGSGCRKARGDEARRQGTRTQ